MYELLEWDDELQRFVSHATYDTLEDVLFVRSHFDAAGVPTKIERVLPD